MSIINDALKKTQLNIKKPKRTAKKQDEQVQHSGEDITNVYEKMYKTREEQRAASEHKKQPAGKDSSGTSKTGKHIPSWLQKSLVFVLVGIFVFASYMFLSNFKPFQDFVQSIKGDKSSRSHIPRTTAKKRVYKPGELVLNGTSLIDGKQVALINDMIYEIGEVINGKTITYIGSDSVELRDKEKIITLKVR